MATVSQVRRETRRATPLSAGKTAHAPELRSPRQDSAQSRGREGWQMVAPTMTWVTLPHYTHMLQQSVRRDKFYNIIFSRRCGHLALDMVIIMITIFYKIDMAQANNSTPDFNVPGANPQAPALQAGNGAAVGNIPNQANWAAMNWPNTQWRRRGRLVRTPAGIWQKNHRDGRLYSV